MNESHPSYPHPWESPKHVEKYGATSKERLDLTSAETRRGEVRKARWSFEHFVELDPSTITDIPGGKLGD